MSNDDYDEFNDEEEMDRQQEEMDRQQEEMDREFEREQRRLEREHRHGRHPLPPIPPVPPVPPIPPVPPLALGSFFEDESLEEEHFFRSRKRKNITVRGMRTDLYDKFSFNIQGFGLNLGIVVSKMLLSANNRFNGDFPDLSAKDILPPKRLMRLVIEHIESIKISKLDLEEAESKIKLRKINRVTILNDVTDEMLKRYIESIEHCDLVLIPKSIPKLVGLSLLSKCKAYEFY